MMRATLWAQCALCLLLCYNTQAQTTYAQFGSTPSTIADDGTEQIGIGITAPDAKLHVFGNCDNDAIIRVSNTACAPYYFIGQTNVVKPGPVFETETRFVINNQGYVGIGEADPDEPLTIKHRYDYTPTPPYYSPLATNRVMTIRDKDDEEVISIGVSSDGTNHGSMMMVRSTPDVPGFVVWNGLTNSHVMVAGNGSFGLGLGITDQPVAHLDIRKITGLDYLLNIANSDNTSQYLTVNKDGNVGIGLTATGITAKLSVAGSVDLYQTSTDNPYLNIKDVSGNTMHYIADEAGYLTIAPGVGGGAYNKLIVGGDLNISGKLSIGSTSATSTTGAVYSNYKLSVDGQIAAKEVVVQTANWQDTVFSDTYKLMELEMLKKFIEQNRHLPEIPSESDAIANGFGLGEMNKLLLMKVEELTLHVIRLDEENRKLFQLISK